MGESGSERRKSQNKVTSEGWQGQLSLEFDYLPNPLNTETPKPAHDGTTRLIHSHGIAPLKVQRPFYPEGPRVCHSVIVHTAGGMVGGDRLQYALLIHPTAHALVTTAAASKAYKSNGHVAHQSVHVSVAEGGCLEWLPQPLILFNGAQYQQHLRVDLAPKAIWIGWDITRLGRTLRGESFDQGVWRSRLEVWQNGSPLWIDPQWVQGGSEMLTSLHGLAHCPVIGTFAIVGVTMSDNIVHQARQLWSETPDPLVRSDLTQGNRQEMESVSSFPRLPMTGVSQLQAGLICRYRGASTIAAQRWFMKVWHLLRQTYLSRPSCTPRVWQTSDHARTLH